MTSTLAYLVEKHSLAPTHLLFYHMTDVQTLPKPLIDVIAGFLAGIASTVVGHPFDVIKTRLQGMPHFAVPVPTIICSILRLTVQN